MKKIFFSYLIPSIIAGGICISCKKEKSCEGCRENNKPPIAIAGPDQVITLPTDSISWDGSASHDPDGKISEWRWQKISGPASFSIVTSAQAKTSLKNLEEGSEEKEQTTQPLHDYVANLAFSINIFDVDKILDSFC